MSDERKPREPLSFWETVGANVVAGVITGAVTTGLGVIAIAVTASKIAAAASRETMLSMGVEPPLSPSSPPAPPRF